MKAASAATVSLLAQDAMTLATCWRVIRRDGAVYTFTDHNRDLIVGGETYLSRLGFARAAISSTASLAADGTDIVGMLDATTITEHDLRAGLWDYAEMRIFLVNWAAPNDGQIKLRRGWLGEVTTDDLGAFNAELRSLTARLVQKTGELYSPNCRAQLGDTRCGIDLAAITAAATVTTATSRGNFVVSGATAPAAGSYVGGVAAFTTGLNAGIKREILDFDAGTGAMTLFLPMPYAVAVGDAVSMTPGCDLTRATCIAFGNIVNFRGEPYVPGADALMAVGQPPA